MTTTNDAISAESARIVPEGGTIDKVAGSFTFTVGTVWNGREEHITWADIIGDKILKRTPGEGATAIMPPADHANGLALEREERLGVAG